MYARELQLSVLISVMHSSMAIDSVALWSSSFLCCSISEGWVIIVNEPRST